MTLAAGLALAVAAVLAVADWVAVARRSKALEYVCKPATVAALTAAAVAVDPEVPGRRAWFVAALVLSLAGDVALMLPSDRFVAGLAAFLLAHLAYVAGLTRGGPGAGAVAAAAVPVAAAGAVVGGRILVAVRAHDRVLVGPVTAYMAVISAMVTLALASGEPWAAAGAALFFLSDALIAWSRFVRPLPWAPVAIMVTYHLAQAGLVLSLAG